MCLAILFRQSPFPCSHDFEESEVTEAVISQSH